MITDFPTDALAAVDKDDRRPAYTQIADQLRRLILERHVTPGRNCPSNLCSSTDSASHA